MHCETKKRVRLTLLHYSFYCGGLELNPQYLAGMPGILLGFIQDYKAGVQ